MGNVTVLLLAHLVFIGTSDYAAATTAVRIVDFGISAHARAGHSDWNTAVAFDDLGNTYAVFNDESLGVVCVMIDSENNIFSAIVSTGVANDAGHSTPSVAVDGDGYIYVWYDMHNDEMKLRRSAVPRRVDHGWLPETGPWSGRYTYPAATVATDGSLYFAARNRRGWSCQLFHRRSGSTDGWRLIADFARADGYVCYLPRPYAASNGEVHLSFQWRKERPGSDRHVGSYAVYDPVEDIFRRADGTRYLLPITPGTADVYQPLETVWAERYGISDHALTVNERGQALVTYNFFRSGKRDERVVRLARWDGIRWIRSDLAGPVSGSTLGDPEIVSRDGKIHVFYKDRDGRLVWTQSVDDGLNFGPDISLTNDAVSSPWVHVGHKEKVTEEPVFVCGVSGATCRVLFVSYGVSK